MSQDRLHFELPQLLEAEIKYLSWVGGIPLSAVVQELLRLGLDTRVAEIAHRDRTPRVEPAHYRQVRHLRVLELPEDDFETEQIRLWGLPGLKAA